MAHRGGDKHGNKQFLGGIKSGEHLDGGLKRRGKFGAVGKAHKFVRFEIWKRQKKRRKKNQFLRPKKYIKRAQKKKIEWEKNIDFQTNFIIA